MITSPTVLILGAGASIPYGFPSGFGLVREMVADLQEGTDSYLNLLAAGFAANEIGSFRFALERSGRSSVDAFLEHRPEFTSVGKAAIAALLLPCENSESLFDLENRASWYGYLFQHLNAGFDEFGDNKLSIVTFNYDRSLEFYLCTALKHSYGRSEEDAATVVRRIPVVHIYGQLGLLPELAGAGVSYGAAPSLPEVLHAAASGIRIIHEGVLEDAILRRAVALLESADTVCFLGFGYHATNLARLGIPASCSSANVFGSASGLSRREVERITSLFDQESGRHIEIEYIYRECIDFLHHMTPFDPSWPPVAP